MVHRSVERRPLTLGVWGVNVDLGVPEQRANVFDVLDAGAREVQRGSSEPISSVDIEGLWGNRR